MYIVDTAITVRWTLAPTDTPLVEGDYDIRVIPSDLNGTYTDAGIINFVAPSAGYGGVIEYIFTPTTYGKWKIYLATGTGASYQVLDEKDLWVFLESPVSVSSLKAIGPMSTSTVVPISPIATIVVTEGHADFGFGDTDDGMKTVDVPRGPFGSAAPLTYQGNIITALCYTQFGGPYTFEFSILGTSHPQTLFTSLTPQDGTLLTSASASFGVISNYTQWSWGSLTKPARWDNTGTSTVEFL